MRVCVCVCVCVFERALDDRNVRLACFPLWRRKAAKVWFYPRTNARRAFFVFLMVIFDDMTNAFKQLLIFVSSAALLFIARAMNSSSNKLLLLYRCCDFYYYTMVLLVVSFPRGVGTREGVFVFVSLFFSFFFFVVFVFSVCFRGICCVSLVTFSGATRAFSEGIFFFFVIVVAAAAPAVFAFFFFFVVVPLLFLCPSFSAFSNAATKATSSRSSFSFSSCAWISSKVSFFPCSASFEGNQLPGEVEENAFGENP
jgi:hypothetical protein